MTKTINAPSQRSPAGISVGEDVLEDELLALAQTLNYSAANYGECHLSIACGPAGWDDHAGYGTVPAGAGFAAPALNWPITGSAVIKIDRQIWIDQDHGGERLECAAENLVQTGNTVRVVFAVTGSLGVATATIDCTDADNGDEVMGILDLNPATAGGEACRLTISYQRIAGASADNEPRSLRVEEMPLASVLDPTDD